MKSHNKLVRDNIVKIIEENGDIARYRYLSKEEVMPSLKDKLKEEVLEFEKDESIEELADIMEVIDAILKEKNISKEELEKYVNEKKEIRGGFDNHLYLVSTYSRGV